MKVVKKIILIIVLGLLLIMTYFQLFYDPCGWRSSTGFVNNGSPYSLAIANEGSHFKDSVARILVNHYESKGVRVEVIPISSLAELTAKDFSALVILHSWYTWNPPPEVERFIKKHRDCLDKIVVLTTSTEGSLKMDEVDAITGASRMGDAVLFADKIIKRINFLLGTVPAENSFPD